MKALGGSYSKFVTFKQREKERAVLCSTEIALSRQEAFFLAHQERVRNGFCLAAKFEHKLLHSISASISAQTDGESEEIQTMQTDLSKTARVRFRLNKECTFGQQFVIVGDDPIVGSWDPSDGVPLIWSEGHVWTAEMDIPSGKVIKFKFILRGDGENILWQPGPDRVLETWYTDKTITVFEDWDDPETQKIVEEEIVAEIKNESLIDSDLFVVAESPKGQMLDKETDVINELAEIKNESLIDSDLFVVAESPNGQMLDKETDVFNELADAHGRNDHLEIINAEKGINYFSSENEKRIILDEGVRVLVPGLISIEEGGINEVEIVKRVEKASDDIEDSVELEETCETVMMSQTNGAEHILESDFQWGRRTLEKLLSNLGFQ